MLNCGKNGELPSRKNFVLSGEDGDESYLFMGKVGKGVFKLTVKWPLSLFQAFAVAISRIEHKGKYLQN